MFNGCSVRDTHMIAVCIVLVERISLEKRGRAAFQFKRELEFRQNAGQLFSVLCFEKLSI